MNNSFGKWILHIRKAVLQVHIKKFHSATGEKISFVHLGLKVIKTQRSKSEPRRRRQLISNDINDAIRTYTSFPVMGMETVKDGCYPGTSLLSVETSDVAVMHTTKEPRPV